MTFNHCGVSLQDLKLIRLKGFLFRSYFKCYPFEEKQQSNLQITLQINMGKNGKAAMRTLRNSLSQGNRVIHFRRILHYLEWVMGQVSLCKKGSILSVFSIMIPIKDMCILQPFALSTKYNEASEKERLRQSQYKQLISQENRFLTKI